MSKPQYARETEQVQRAHPELNADTAQRIAEQYVEVARETGAPFQEVLADSVRAENGSAAGNDVTA